MHEYFVCFLLKELLRNVLEKSIDERERLTFTTLTVHQTCLNVSGHTGFTSFGVLRVAVYGPRKLIIITIINS